MIAETRPDVVHVLTPPDTHCEVAIQAINAGCHVLVEKPMAMSVLEASRMLEVSEQQNVRLGVCHNFRFVPAFLKALELLERGVLGEVVSVEAFWKVTAYTPKQRGTASGWIDALPGGIFQEVAPHLVYLLMAVAGPLKLHAVVVSGANGRRHRDELRALFESDRGPTTLGISVAASPVQKFVRIYGTHGSLHVDLATSVLVYLRGRTDGVMPRALLNFEHAAQLAGGTLANVARVALGRLRRGHETLIACFYDSLRRGEPPPVDAREGLSVVVVLDQMWRALEKETAATCAQSSTP